ncbi:MAG: hypothetical protein V1904_15415 [Bacteroidota bacterium]
MKKTILLFIVFVLLHCLFISCNKHTADLTINGQYETGWPYFTHSTYILKNGKFKSTNTTDIGWSKCFGTYKINWQDSIITFKTKRVKGRVLGRFSHKNGTHLEETYKINDTELFSFYNYKKKK